MNPSLTILPAGAASIAERHVLAKSMVLTELLDVLGTKFDHLVLDLPPVLTVSEASVLAGLAEAFILVVRQGVTAEHSVRSALHELRHLVALGVVLNRTTTHAPKRVLELLSD
jgi:Mrp family chromosome partitioning ATPase